MSVPLTIGREATVRIELPAPAEAVAAKFYSPRGEELDDDLVVTLEEFDDGGAAGDPIEIESAAADDAVTLSATSGLYAGQLVYWDPSPRTIGSPVWIAEIGADDAVTFETAPPGSPLAGDVIRPLFAFITIPAALLGELGVRYRVEWSATLLDGSKHDDRTMVHVVMTPFHDPVTALDVRAYVDGQHSAITRDAGWYRRMARKASERVYRKLVATGRLPDLIGDRSMLKDVGRLALQMELTYEALVPGGQDPADFRLATESAIARGIEEIISENWVDRDQSGNPSSATAVRPAGSTRLVRAS